MERLVNDQINDFHVRLHVVDDSVDNCVEENAVDEENVGEILHHDIYVQHQWNMDHECPRKRRA